MHIISTLQHNNDTDYQINFDILEPTKRLLMSTQTEIVHTDELIKFSHGVRYLNIQSPDSAPYSQFDLTLLKETNRFRVGYSLLKTGWYRGGHGTYHQEVSYFGSENAFEKASYQRPYCSGRENCDASDLESPTAYSNKKLEGLGHVLNCLDIHSVDYGRGLELYQELLTGALEKMIVSPNYFKQGDAPQLKELLSHNDFFTKENQVNPIEKMFIQNMHSSDMTASAILQEMRNMVMVLG